MYIIITGLSLPGAAILTLAAGAIFRLAVGGRSFSSFASTIGATLAFFFLPLPVSGNPFRDVFADKLTAINKGMAEDGAFYLFHIAPGADIPVFSLSTW